MNRREPPPKSQVNAKGDIRQGAGSVIGTDLSQNKVIIDHSSHQVFWGGANRKENASYWFIVSGVVSLAVFAAAQFLIPSIPYRLWWSIGIAVLAGIVTLRLNPDYWARSMIFFLILLAFGRGAIDWTGAFEISSDNLGHISGQLHPSETSAWHYFSTAVVVTALIIYESLRCRTKKL